MNQIATRDRTRIGGWSVPVGAVMADELRPCNHCGHDVNVLTVATQDGPIVMADDVHDQADEDNTICAGCLHQMGPDDD